MNFVVFDLNQDLNISKGIFFNYYQCSSLGLTVFGRVLTVLNPNRNLQLHSAIAAANMVLPVN